MSERIEAPFTAEQVLQLNNFQHHGGMHPFTCPTSHDEGRDLVATLAGWICPHCSYRQSWAHDFMADGSAVEAHREMMARHRITGNQRSTPPAESVTGVAAVIDGRLALANWQKYNGNQADEVVYQAEKLATSLSAALAALTPSPVAADQSVTQEQGASLRDRATAVEPVPVSPLRDGIPSAGFGAELQAIVAGLRGKVPDDVITALMPSLMDSAYNAEYERKNLSAWESTEYRPYCMSCSTMRRMEHRDYGYQCSVCGSKCPAQAIEAGTAETGTGSVERSEIEPGGEAMRPNPPTKEPTQ